MITLADEWAGLAPMGGNAPARAREYGMAGLIPPDCHKLKQSAAYNGIVMMQMPQVHYRDQRHRNDTEHASVMRSHAPSRIMQRRDDAAMMLCAYRHKSCMRLCAYAAMRMRA